jgi:hypothetical protein
MSPATKKELSAELLQRLLNDESVLDRICHRAYEIFQSRGQEHGHDQEDWLQAEIEIIDQMVEEELLSTLDPAPADFPNDELPQEIPIYTSWAPKPEPALPGPPIRSISDRPWLAHTPFVSGTSPESSRSLEKPSKAISGRKDKKKDKNTVEPSAGDAKLAAPGDKSKKAGHKSKASDKREKKTEHREKEKRSGKP